MKNFEPPWIMVAFAAVQLVFASVQIFVARNNFRLSLYNRRFNVYSSLLSLKVWLDGYDGSIEMEASGKDVREEYIKACRESKFLFDPKDGVQSLLEEVFKIFFRELCWRKKCSLSKTHGRHSLSSAEVADLAGEGEEHLLDSRRLEEMVIMLEEILDKYLQFGGVGSRFTAPAWLSKIGVCLSGKENK